MIDIKKPHNSFFISFFFNHNLISLFSVRQLDLKEIRRHVWGIICVFLTCSTNVFLYCRSWKNKIKLNPKMREKS